MKKLAIGFVFVALCPSHACIAQCPSNKGQLDISVSQGIITSDQVAQQFTTGDNTNSSGNNKKLTYNSGATFFSIRYFMYNRLALGISGGITNERGQYTDRTNPSFITSTYKQGITTYAIELYYIYTFRKYFEVYTLIGAGPSFTKTGTTTFTTPNATGAVTNTSDNNLKAQYSPIGIRFGGRLGGFLELGVGYKGVINGGISYKLGRSCWWK